MPNQLRFRPLLLLLATAAACSDVAVPTAPPESPVSVVEAALTASTVIQRGKNDAGKVLDTTLNAILMRQNFGDDARLVISKRNEVLLRFDLASIPSNAVVNSATLTLYMHGHDDDDDDHDCDHDRDEDRRGYQAVPIDIKLATSPWVERQVTYRSFDQDFLPSVVGMLIPAGKNTYKSLDLKAAVQQWVAGQRANYGLVLMTNSRKRWAFASSENSRVALRPSLTISYSTPDDHCAPNPCQHGGACTNSWTDYTCQCPPGWTGAQCHTNIDDCAGAPCMNGGSCSDGVATYTCACPAGFGGAQCQTNINECAPNPCQNGGVCSDDVNAFSCACALGYSGATCATLVDNCAAAPCQNGGTCTNGVGAYTCACAAGFAGLNCEVDIDDCAGAPCMNGGACVDGVNDYECNCAAGYTGPDCETNIDDCAAAPCLNGGTCADSVTSYVCTCATGFTGTQCEVNVDDCASHPCQNGGVCVDGDASYTCACTAGYQGANCEAVCTGSHPATVVANLGDVIAPSGYVYSTPTNATAYSANECPSWSCGVGLGPAAGAIDDVAATGWNSGTWDFGGGFTLTLNFNAPQSFNGLHVISQLWPTDDITFTVTLTNDSGATTTLAPTTATIHDMRPNGTQDSANIGFSASGYQGIVSVAVHMSAPYESPEISTWLDVRELQLIVPAGCEPPPPACPAGTTAFAGHCYQGFTDVPASSSPFNYWRWADADCNSRWPGARLATIADAAENTFVRGLVPTTKGVMLFGSDEGRATNSYVWLDGTPLTYTNWSAGEPNSRGVNRYGTFLTEDWIMMNPDGTWNDLPYTDGSGYVCELAQ